MIKKVKEHILNNKESYKIGSILFIFTILTSLYSFNYVEVWWDEAIYIGMGKYIATNGVVGIWEMFRPPLLPLIYAFLFKLGIPLYFAGKLMVIIVSSGVLWLTYKIGESIHKNAGIFASIFLAITPVFFSFTKIATTDITSIFFILLALYFYNRNKYFWTGFFIAVSFLLRFPQGLALLSIGIAIIFNNYNSNFKVWIKGVLIQGLWVALGFLLLIVPYFISNYLMYKDIFKPLIYGSNLVTNAGGIYNLGVLYYVKELWRIAPFLYFVFVIPFIFFKKDFFTDMKVKRNLITILIIAIIFTLYFSWQPHKELRYSLAFVSYLAILSGVSFSYVLKRFKLEKYILILLIIGLTFFIYKGIASFKYQNNNSAIYLNNYMKTLEGKYISSTPIISIFGDVKIISIFESTSSFDDVFNGSREVIDGVMINDCDIFCPEKSVDKLCIKDLDYIHSKIEKSLFKKSFEIEVNKCMINIYKK